MNQAETPGYQPGNVIAVEVKAATRWGSGDLTGLKAFLGLRRRCKLGFLACNGT
jgi:hypothetical protein